MNSSDLGPAMAMDGARSQGRRGAIEAVAKAAQEAAEHIRSTARELGDPHDFTAVMNLATGFDIFAAKLRGVL